MSWQEEAQRLVQAPIVKLFEIDAQKWGEGILRFVTEPLEDGSPVVFNGYTYKAVPIVAEEFEWTDQGAMPRPKLTITAMQLAFLSLVISADDLLGAPVRRIRVYRKHLDDGIDPDPEATFPIDYYRIERKIAQTSKQIRFELAVPLDQQGRMIPHRQVLRDTCTHSYRWWDGQQYRYEGVSCPYSGGGEWDKNGNYAPTGEDKCGKRLSDCRLRFGENAVLPIRAFPGVGRI